MLKGPGTMALVAMLSIASFFVQAQAQVQTQASSDSIGLPEARVIGEHDDSGTEASSSEEPDGFRLTGYLAPVPKTLTGATTLDTAELETLLAVSQSMQPLLIDVLPATKKPPWWPAQQVWLPEPHLSIPSAYWLPEVGFGTINEAVEISYRKFLREKTRDNLAYPVVVFCRDNCWISWNAAKRLLLYGYQQVYWYPRGMDGWAGHKNDTRVVQPETL